MQKDYRDMVYEFARKAADFGTVKAVILFGSVARGNADRRSDIDMLIVLDKKSREEDALFRLSQEIGAKHDRTIQTVFSEKGYNSLDRKFVETILKEGIMLYGAIPWVKHGKLLLEPHAIFTYKSTEKISRILHGYRTTKVYKRKLYRSESEGLLKKHRCRLLGRGAFITAHSSASIFQDLFKEHKIKHSRRDIWQTAVIGNQDETK
ncbi:MAG: nucleotidyltransferase domain-containing protein [Candidatus Woesearchaeota archaeon]